MEERWLGKKSMERPLKFVEQLYKEKEIHKEHRHNLLIKKLIFVTSLFGIGSIGLKFTDLIILLFFIPYVAVCFDIYIFSEDFKVKRIGYYIILLKSNYYEGLPKFINEPIFETEIAEAICYLEAYWERWVENFREPWASKASFIISLVATLIAAFLLAIGVFYISIENYYKYKELMLIIFIIWFLIAIFTITLVFIQYQNLMKRLFKLPIVSERRVKK